MKAFSKGLSTGYDSARRRGAVEDIQAERVDIPRAPYRRRNNAADASRIKTNKLTYLPTYLSTHLLTYLPTYLPILSPLEDPTYQLLTTPA